MSAFQRVGREYLAQVAAFLVALADRLIIPAVFLRTLGVAAFSGWAIAIACGAFVAVLEFGVTRYFTNRLIQLVEQGDVAGARRVFREGVTLILGLVVVALLAIAIGYRWFVGGVSDPAVDAQLWLVAVPVTGAAAALQLIALRQVLYRAHREFELETWIRCAGEAARIATAAIAALAGASLVAVGWAWLVATLLFVVLPITLHTRARYGDYGTRPLVTNAIERGMLFTAAPGLWLQSMFTTLYATIPVFAIGALSGTAAVIAQFVLMRTIANFVRQILQMFANVFGIELARRHAREDVPGFAAVFGETNRFLAVQTAVGSAALIVLAQPLFALWTGNAQLYDRTMLIFAILPPLLIPSAMLSIEALAYANRPWPVVRARLIQAAASVLLFVVLPIEHVGLRMMAALAVGEIVGLGLPLAIELRRLNPLVGLRSVAVLTLRGLAAFALTFVLVEAVWQATGGSGPLALGLAVLAAGVALLLAMAFLGVGADRRRAILTLARGRLAPR